MVKEVRAIVHGGKEQAKRAGRSAVEWLRSRRYDNYRMPGSAATNRRSTTWLALSLLTIENRSSAPAEEEMARSWSVGKESRNMVGSKLCVRDPFARVDGNRVKCSDIFRNIS